MAHEIYGTTWWGQKWLDALKGIDYSNRILRGLSYARNDNVFDLDINLQHHKISAKVKGSYNNHYDIEIGFALASRGRIKVFMDLVAKDLEIVSLLINRELSPRLFDIANSCNLQIFPTSWRDLHMFCNCPDSAVPCKHIAAVIYEVSQLFDANPDLIFKLIGIDLHAELVTRQVFLVGTSSSRLMPKFHDYYLQSLIGSEQLKELASEYDMDLNLVTLDEYEAKILYQDQHLITYDVDKDGVIFDQNLRESFKFLHKQQELVKSYAHSLEQIQKEIENCKNNIAEKESYLNKYLRQIKILQKKQYISVYDQARINSYVNAQQEIDIEKTHLQKLLTNYLQLKNKHLDAQNKFDEVCLKNKQSLKEQFVKQQDQLRLGYDVQAEHVRLEKEAFALAEQAAQDAAQFVLSDFDAIDNGDDSYSTQEIAAIDADKESIDGTAGIAGNDICDGVDSKYNLKIRRYKGSIEQLEQLTYELQIPDLSTAILQLFSENAAGYAEGNLRNQFDITLKYAAKLASRQLEDRNDRDFVVFAYEKSRNLNGADYDNDAAQACKVKQLEAQKVVPKEGIANKEEEAEEFTYHPSVILKKIKTNNFASLKVKEVAASNSTTTAMGKVLGLVKDPSKVILRKKSQIKTAVAIVEQQYRKSTIKFYKGLIAFFKANVEIHNCESKQRGFKSKIFMAALKQEQEVLSQLLLVQAERLAALGLQLPADSFEKELHVQIYASALYAIENKDEFRAVILFNAELVKDISFWDEQSALIEGCANRIRQKLAELMDMEPRANMLSSTIACIYIAKILQNANSEHHVQSLVSANRYLIAVVNEDAYKQNEPLYDLLQYSVLHPLILHIEQNEPSVQKGQSSTNREGHYGCVDSKDPYAKEKQAVLYADSLGVFDSASPNFTPWIVDKNDLKIVVCSNPVYREAAQILWEGKRFPQQELELLNMQQIGEPLKQFSSLPLAPRGYFAHRPLFYWDKHALHLQVCTPMSVLTFDHGQERRYKLYVLPKQSSELSNYEKELSQRAKMITKKNLVDEMYKQLAANKSIKILKNSDNFAKCVVQPDFLEACQDGEPAGLYEMFSGFTSGLKDRNSKKHCGSNEKISEQSLEIRILYCLWFIASNLVKKRAIMPQLLVNEANALQCRWLPATISPEIKELVIKVGLALQGYEHFLFNRLDRQYYLHPQFLGEILLAPFIQSYLSWARNQQQQKSGVYDDNENDKAPSDLSVIFSGMELPLDSLSSRDFELTGIRYRLENWLSPVNISTEQRYIPVLRFVDLGDYDCYGGTIFSRLTDEIRSEAESTFVKQQEKVDSLMQSADTDTLKFIKQTITEQEVAIAQDTDAKSDIYAKNSSDDIAVAARNAKDKGMSKVDDGGHIMQWGVGIEMGFMGFESEIYNQLAINKEEYVNDIANTGFVPLKQIISNDVFQYVRHYCMSTIARFSLLVPSLSKLFNSRFNVMVVPLAEIYQLLNVASSTLKMLGVRLILPKSLSRLLQPAAIMKLDIDKDKGLKHNSRSFITLQSMLNFHWQIAVGDHVLNGDEFKLLMANAGQIVRFKSGFVYADVEMLHRIQENFQKLQITSTSKPSLLEAVLTGSYKDNNDNYNVVLSDQLRESLDYILETNAIELPQGLKKDVKLRNYQIRGYEWLVRNARIQLGSILADDMGLGKTLQVITALLRLKEDQFITLERPALVIVPTSLLTNWKHEINHYSEGLSSFIYYGAGSKIQSIKSDVILTSYGTARTRIAQLRKWHFGVLVIDEAQNIKNTSTELNKALSSLKADHFIAMSGTPVENRLLEYFSVLNFVNRGLFGSAISFNKRFAEPIEQSRDPQALKRFKRLTAPFIMRRLKTDKNVISDLPDKIISDQFCSLTPTQALLYQSVVDDKMKELEKSSSDNRRNVVLSLIQSLKAVCNSPAQYLPNSTDYDPADSGKVERLLELLNEAMNNGGKVLIFTQSVIMGRFLQDIIGKQFKRRPSFLYGSLNPIERGDLVHKFQNDTQERIMLLSLRAGGTGFNLTAANIVIHFDLWWNPAVENQATDRAFRIGQKRTVMVYRFVCAHTFEERINAMIQSKRDLANLAVVSGENWIGNLSNRQLNDLFSLQEE